MIGRTLSHYRVLERLGSGGMGEVYLAVDTRLGRKVALKVPPAHLLDQPLQLARFQREARALAAVHHHNVVTIYSVEEHEGLSFLTMELIEGKTLSELIPSPGMSLGHVLDVGVQMADGLTAAHEQGVLHRDLKPGNIMVDAQGRVTILDFGIAQRLSSSDDVSTLFGEMETLTEEGEVVGTVAYMSPEQIRRQPLDARSDIFSFGIILYQMATGSWPFRGSDTAARMLAILEQPASPPSRVRSGLSPRFDEIVLRCLQKQPQHRYPSTHVLRHDLAELRQKSAGKPARQQDLAQAPTEVAVPPWSPLLPTGTTSEVATALELTGGSSEPGLASRGSRLVRAAVPGAALAFLLGFGGWYALRDSRQSGAAAPLADAARPTISALAVLPLQNLSGEPEYFSDGMTEALISSLGSLGHIRVISRQSVIRYKRSEKPLPVIAKELGVDVVLTGTAIRSGGRLRVTAQLIRAEPEQQIWSTIMNRDARDVLALQDDVAREVAHQVRAELTDQEKARLTDARPVDPAVYDLYLQGRFHLNKRTRDDLRLGVDYFKKALAADPTYAPAYAGLAASYNLFGFLGIEPRDAAFRQARAAVSRALELDGALAEAHAARGLVLMDVDWDLAGAERAFRKAIELNPSYAHAHQWLAQATWAENRLEETGRHLNLARQLDPLSSVIVYNLSEYARGVGDHDRALDWARKAVELEPRWDFAHEQLWKVLHAKGRWAEAFKELEQTLSLGGNGETARLAGSVYARSGYRAALLAACRSLGKSRPEDGDIGSMFPVLAAVAGDRARAIAALERAVDRREPFVLWIGHTIEFKSLRGDPRFKALIRRVQSRAPG